MLARLKIGTALFLGFTAALGVALVIALAALFGLGGVEKGVNDLSDLALPGTRALATFDEARSEIARNINALMLPRLQGELRQANMEAISQARDRFHKGRKAWEAVPSFPQTRATWQEMVPMSEAWEKQVQTALDSMKKWETFVSSGVAWDNPQLVKQYDQVWASYVELRNLSSLLDAALAKVRTAMEKEAEQRADEAHQIAHRAKVTFIVTLFLGATALVVLASLLTRGITRVVRDLSTESDRLKQAVREGRLDTRGNSARVHFQFRGLVEGMNETMDAFLEPYQAAIDAIEGIAHGTKTALITTELHGDFNRMKDAVNQLTDTVNRRSIDMDLLIEAALHGKLDLRADASRYQGEHARMIEGVNSLLETVVAPINEASAVLQKLAQRDLRARMSGSYQGDHAKLQESVNRTAEALHEAISQVAQAVGQVSAAAGQIASSSEAVAAGASEQASSLEETSSSLESMSSTTKQAADSAQQANGLAKEASKAAAEGASAMQQMSGAMEKIKASAEGTSQIIKDINEIAFQTNLLALNAAVEAARAGEAGRGFAVVAEEVRSLALRSKEAANKTEALIRQSVKEAGEGEVTARQVGEQLGAITSSVGKANDIVAEIAAAAREQVAAIDQVNKAVAQVGQVTQHNAANSEESSSAAAELSGEAEKLAAMVSTFELEHDTAAPRATERAVKPLLKPSSKAKLLPGRQNGKAAKPARPEDVFPLDDTPSFKEF
jgi:methyl-accepting chemotaxis protein